MQIENDTEVLGRSAATSKSHSGSQCNLSPRATLLATIKPMHQKKGQLSLHVDFLPNAPKGVVICAHAG